MINKRLPKCIISMILVVGCLIGTVMFAGAIDNDTLLRGDSDFSPKDQTLIEQFEELWSNSSTGEERQMILKKAYQMGIDVSELTDATLSKNDITMFSTELSINDRPILTADITTNSAARASTTVAGVAMPDYALWPPIYKQETSTYCSAATVYTVAKYIGATPPSQSSIMSFWKSQWGVTYPDLPLVRNYLNLYLPGKPSDYVPYVYKKYAGNQTTFNTDLKNNVQNYQPMILLMKNNTSETTNWPYKTNGHFCMCNGLLTWENNQYFIGDPYYFLKYVSSATADNGEHKKTWTQLNAVITNKFGSGSQYYLT